MKLGDNMKNRGFTLIELLAVIMIIGIIALVTTPLVMNQIEKSKKETLRDSIKGMVNAITYYQKENEIFTGGTYTVDGSSLKAGSTKIEVDGSILGTGTIIMNSKDEATIKIQYQQYCATGSLKNLKVEKKRCN